MHKLTVLGVSAGNGVILHPFKDDPFKIIGNIECRSDYLIQKQPLQLNLNFPDVPFFRDTPSDVPAVDVIVGHPKCGYSSMFALSRGKKFRSHEGEPSLDLFFKAVTTYWPKFFMFENLAGLLQTYTTYQLWKIFKRYIIIMHNGSVAKFGNSQASRKRIVIVGIHRDIYNADMVEDFRQDGIIGEYTPKVASDLLKDLPANGHHTENIQDYISVYGGCKMKLSELQEYWENHPGQRHFNIDGGRMKTAPGVYINRWFDIPLTVRKTNRQFNAKGIQMSPRELARIQGIPDNFLLYEDFDNMTTTINKGRITVANTPPYEIGQWFRDRILSAMSKYRINLTSSN